MPITLDRRPKGTYPSGVFHISLGSTLCIESELKSEVTLGNVPSLVAYIKTRFVCKRCDCMIWRSTIKRNAISANSSYMRNRHRCIHHVWSFRTLSLNFCPSFVNHFALCPHFIIPSFHILFFSPMHENISTCFVWKRGDSR
jgi:hypothetical protein